MGSIGAILCFLSFLLRDEFFVVHYTVSDMRLSKAEFNQYESIEFCPII
jgi:hypothetical protein